MGQKIGKKKFWRKKKGSSVSTRGLAEPEFESVEKWKDILIRAGKTALQAFFAALPIIDIGTDGGRAMLRSAIIAAIAAGLSAGMNVVIAALGDDNKW